VLHSVVITGGHLDKAIDLLSFTSGRGVAQEVFKSDRLRSNSTTALAARSPSAMVCHLAQRPRIARGRAAGEGVCRGGDCACASSGTGYRAGAPFVSHASTEAGCDQRSGIAELAHPGPHGGGCPNPADQRSLADLALAQRPNLGRGFARPPERGPFQAYVGG